MGLIDFILMLNSGASSNTPPSDFTWGSEDYHMGDTDRFMGDE